MNVVSERNLVDRLHLSAHYFRLKVNPYFEKCAQRHENFNKKLKPSMEFVHKSLHDAVIKRKEIFEMKQILDYDFRIPQTFFLFSYKSKFV